MSLKDLNHLGDLLIGLAHCVRHVAGRGGQALPADRLELEARTTHMLEQLEHVGLIGNWETIAEWRSVARGEDVSQEVLGDLVEAGVLRPVEELFPGCQMGHFAGLTEQWAEAEGLPHGDPAAPSVEPPPGTEPQDRSLVRGRAFHSNLTAAQRS